MGVSTQAEGARSDRGVAMGATAKKEILKDRPYRKSMNPKTECAVAVASKPHGAAGFGFGMLGWNQAQRGSMIDRPGHEGSPRLSSPRMREVK